MHGNSLGAAGIVVLAAAIAISVLNQLASMPLSILDTDPSTYIVVAVLMLPIFALFYMKSGISMKASAKGIAIGVALFALYVAVTTYLRYGLYYEFLSFRLDLLLMPLLLASYISMLFGAKSIAKFKALLFYSIFTSPAILFPIFRLNEVWADVNSILVYHILRIFEHGVSYVAPTFITFGNISISIGEACAGIGVLIAIIMFLAPVSYLYDGKGLRKVYWIASGFALLLLLNVIRMASIGGIWIAYGPQATVSFVHSFAGIFIFYIAIIAMILLIGAYGLGFPARRKPKLKDRIARKDEKKTYAAIALVLLLSIAYFYLTYGYRTTQPLSPINFESVVPFNANNTQLAKSLYATVNSIGKGGRGIEEIVGKSGSPVIMLVSNATYNRTNPIVMAIVPANVSLIKEFLSNSTLSGTKSFMTPKGSVYNMYSIISNGTTFLVAHTFVPVALANNSVALENTYVIMPQQAGSGNATCSYVGAYYYLYNIPNIEWNRQMYNAYCVSERLVAS